MCIKKLCRVIVVASCCFGLPAVIFLRQMRFELMTIIHNILSAKKSLLEQKRSLLSIDDLKSMPYYHSPCNSVVTSLLEAPLTGVIAEFKRTSPFDPRLDVKEEIGPVVESFDAHGASAAAIWTEETYHRGTLEELQYVRGLVVIPLIRFDYLIDEYEIVESKAFGASAIGLSTSFLSAGRLKELVMFSKRLGLEVLVEVTEKAHMVLVPEEADIILVNSNKIETQTVDPNWLFEALTEMPREKIKIAYSSSENVEQLLKLKQLGYQGFVVGESFLSKENPTLAFVDFINEMKNAIKPRYEQ